MKVSMEEKIKDNIKEENKTLMTKVMAMIMDQLEDNN